MEEERKALAILRKIILFAAFVCFAALNVSAQTEKPESKIEKMLRLTKTANENPTDWKAQLEAAHFLLDKEDGIYNQSQAEKYYERLYHLALDYNKEIPDSIIREAGITLITVATDKKNVDMGWMQQSEGSPTVVYGEDGKVYDDKHGYLEYGFDYKKNGIVPKEAVNMRLITVTPEHRQQMVEAYRNYLKEAKKGKK